MLDKNHSPKFYMIKYNLVYHLSSGFRRSYCILNNSIIIATFSCLSVLTMEGYDAVNHVVLQ